MLQSIQCCCELCNSLSQLRSCHGGVSCFCHKKKKTTTPHSLLIGQEWLPFSLLTGSSLYKKLIRLKIRCACTMNYCHTFLIVDLLFSQLKEFVKHAKDNAFIEIELYVFVCNRKFQLWFLCSLSTLTTLIDTVAMATMYKSSGHFIARITTQNGLSMAGRS